jgi:hypothetical protein
MTQLISGTINLWSAAPSNLNSTTTDNIKEAATAAIVT